MIVKLAKLSIKENLYKIEIKEIRYEIARILSELIECKLSYHPVSCKIENLYSIQMNFKTNLKARLDNINIIECKLENDDKYVDFCKLILIISSKKNSDTVDHVIETIRSIYNGLKIFCEITSLISRSYSNLIVKFERINNEDVYKIEFNLLNSSKVAKILGGLIKCTLSHSTFNYSIDDFCSVDINFDSATQYNKLNNDQISYEIKNYEGYDDICKLTLNVKSKKNVSTMDVIIESFSSIISNFQIFYEIVSADFEIYSKIKYSSSYLNLSIENAGFGERIINALKSKKIYSVNDLIKCTEYEIFGIKNLGKTSFDNLKFILNENGFELKDTIETTSLNSENFGRVEIEVLNLDNKIISMLKTRYKYLDEIVNLPDEELTNIPRMGGLTFVKLKKCLKVFNN